MSQHRAENKEPLVHLSKRSSIHLLKAWGIRLMAIVLGLVVCGLVAFLLIEKLALPPVLPNPQKRLKHGKGRFFFLCVRAKK